MSLRAFHDGAGFIQSGLRLWLGFINKFSKLVESAFKGACTECVFKLKIFFKKSVSLTYHIKRLKYENHINHTIILMNAKKKNPFYVIQHIFRIKSPEESRGTSPN